MVSETDVDGRLKRTRRTHRTVVDLLASTFRDFSDRVGIVEGDRAWTFGEVAEIVQTGAEGLAGLGVRRGDLVGLLSSNSAEFAFAEYSTLFAGAGRVGITPRLSVEEVIYIVEDACLVALFADPGWCSRLREDPRWRAADRPTLIELTFMPSTGPTLCDMPAATGPGNSPVQGLLPSDTAYVYYTSGTTGRPKGAVISHAAAVAGVASMMAILPGLNESDAHLRAAPMAHMDGFVAVATIANGARQVVLPRFDPIETLRSVAKFGVTILPLVPTMINLLTDAAAEFKSESGCGTLRLVPYTGSPIAKERLEAAIKIFGPVFVQYYGQSEILPISALSIKQHVDALNGDEPSEHLSSAGRPLPFTEVAIDPLVKGQSEGEILLRSPSAMSGYLNNWEATSSTVTADGWVRTGDIGRVSADGYLYVIDRKNDMVISGGFNVYPAEVERAIYAGTAAREVVVVGVPDDRWGESVVAVVVAGGGSDDRDLKEQVLAACREQLADYKVPKRVHIVDELPKSPTGKLLRRSVKSSLQAS